MRRVDQEFLFFSCRVSCTRYVDPCTSVDEPRSGDLQLYRNGAIGWSERAVTTGWVRNRNLQRVRQVWRLERPLASRL
jgi:hypothetical protein